MTETSISSKSAEVVIGFDRPFVVIGERINPTGRPQLAEEMRSGDLHRVEADALAQVAAGARVLDVNAGIPLADEPAILAGCVRLLQSVTDVPLCIDSSDVAALEAALEAYEGKALLNSVTGDDASLERVLPLVRKYGCAVVAVPNDETGVSEDVEARFAVARKIVERARDHGISPADVVVDALVMPLGALNTAGRRAIDLVRRLRSDLEVNTTCGISNLSFGLPKRDGLNAAFISMAIGGGLTSAIANPLHAGLMQAVRAAEAIMAHDPQCAAWIRASRDPQDGVGSRIRRSGRRRNSSRD